MTAGRPLISVHRFSDGQPNIHETPSIVVCPQLYEPKSICINKAPSIRMSEIVATPTGEFGERAASL